MSDTVSITTKSASSMLLSVFKDLTKKQQLNFMEQVIQVDTSNFKHFVEYIQEGEKWRHPEYGVSEGDTIGIDSDSLYGGNKKYYEDNKLIVEGTVQVKLLKFLPLKNYISVELYTMKGSIAILDVKELYISYIKKVDLV